jgi:hypothetical protein
MSKDPNILAEKFLKDQIRIMKKHGKEPKLGAEQYQKLLEDTQRAFRGLATPKTIAKASHG